MKLVGVYGSLRHGGTNHDLLDTSELVTVLNSVCGYLQRIGDDPSVDHWSYPALCLTGDKPVFMEVYLVDNYTFNYLHQMETGAGYHGVVIPIPDVGSVFMWTKYEQEMNPDLPKYQRFNPITRKFD